MDLSTVNGHFDNCGKVLNSARFRLLPSQSTAEKLLLSSDSRERSLPFGLLVKLCQTQTNYVEMTDLFLLVLGRSLNNCE